MSAALDIGVKIDVLKPIADPTMIPMSAEVGRPEECDSETVGVELEEDVVELVLLVADDITDVSAVVDGDEEEKEEDDEEEVVVIVVDRVVEVALREVLEAGGDVVPVLSS